MKSALFTHALVQSAVDLLVPGIETLIRDSKRVVAYIVVMEPINHDDWQILWKGAIGEQDQSKWPNPYEKFATAKAMVSCQTGLPSHMVQRNSPHLFQNGDFKFGGSVVYNGIVVATSGLNWYHDLAVSGAVAAMCHGFVIGAFEQELARKPYFVGAEDPTPTS